MHRAISLDKIPEDGKTCTRTTRKPRTAEVWEFVHSGDDAWEIIDKDLPTHSVYSSYSSVLRQNSRLAARVTVLERKDRIFLVRKEKRKCQTE